MTKKRKFLVGILTALSVCSMAFALTSCGNPVDKVEYFVDQLFCEHEWNDGEVTKESTCTEKGELTKTCTLCDKEKVEYLELKKHVGVYVESVAPTCTENGKTDGVVCSVCETVISGVNYIPALGHLVVEDVAVENTCLEDGLTRGEHCSRCEEVLLEQVVVPATGHHVIQVAEVAPTCTEKGVKSGVRCEYCDTVSFGFEEIPALGHKHGPDGVSCETCGELDLAKLETAGYVTANPGESFAAGWYKFVDEGVSMCYAGSNGTVMYDVSWDSEKQSAFVIGIYGSTQTEFREYVNFKGVNYNGVTYIYIPRESFEISVGSDTLSIDIGASTYEEEVSLWVMEIL